MVAEEFAGHPPTVHLSAEDSASQETYSPEEAAVAAAVEPVRQGLACSQQAYWGAARWAAVHSLSAWRRAMRPIGEGVEGAAEQQAGLQR